MKTCGEETTLGGTGISRGDNIKTEFKKIECEGVE
jgi:hypothetical protein